MAIKLLKRSILLRIIQMKTRSPGTSRSLTIGKKGVCNLPNALAKVENSKSAINFIKKYGFLGYRMLSKEDLSLGEPLDWILAQARSVRFGLYLIVCLQDQEQKLSELLKTAEVKVRFDQT